MPKTKAAVCTGPHEPFVVRDVDVAAPGVGEVLVKLVATGLCHTDLFFKHSLPPGNGASVLGHEGAGIVEAVGAGVDGIAIGDHVILNLNSCTACAQCLAGRPAYCEVSTAANALRHRANGTPTISSAGESILGGYFGQSSFAGYALATRANTVVVRSDVDLSVVAPLGCGFQTGAGAILNVLRPRPEARLVIYGVGAVGFAALMAAANLGVSTVVGVDPHPARRDLVTSLGATSIDPSDSDADDLILEHTRGGATHAVDTTGRGDVISRGLKLLAATGQFVALGLGEPSLTINVRDLLFKGKTLRGSIAGDSVAHHLVPQLVDAYAAGAFPIDRLITRYAPHDINQAVQDHEAGRVIKPVLVW